MFKRVVIKISGEMLGDGFKQPFNEAVINKMVTEVKQLLEQGVEIALVVGGGNFWRGRENPQLDSVKTHQIGMLATVMNGIYLSEAFRLNNVSAKVLTPFDVNEFAERFNRDKVLEYMSLGTVVIFAGGTGHPFFSTDTIVGLRAVELSADAILFAKNIDGIFDSDPKKNPQAKKYKSVTYKTIIQNSLEFADISAISLINQSEKSIVCIVFNLIKPNCIVAACKNNDEIYAIGGTKVEQGIEEEYYV